MNLQYLLNNKPNIHNSKYFLNNNVLNFIDKNVNETYNTLETGAGISTILFALKYTNHTCIVPDSDQVERIKYYCMQHQISINKINFIIDRSENILHSLQLKLDIVLIDGCHGFPAPFIDWYYTSNKLKVGGKLIIDDTHLWTGHILKKFLLNEEEWAIHKNFFPRAAIFIKKREINRIKEWTSQPYIVHKSKILTKFSKIYAGALLLRKFKFIELINKIKTYFDVKS